MDLKKSSVLDRMNPVLEHAERLEEDFKTRSDLPKISLSSMKRLNNTMWGFKEGELIIIGARTSQGKSSFIGQIAWDLSDEQTPVWVVSLEMDEQSMIERFFCYQMKVNNRSLQADGFLKSAEIQKKWGEFKKMLLGRKLFVTCGIGKTFPEILEAYQFMNPRPKVVIIDYIQAIKARPGEKREEIDEYIRKFRQMAIEEKFCGILCSQINRDVEDKSSKMPNMSQLKSTGTLEESADKVILLYWAYGQKIKDARIEQFTVILAKNRNGATGDIMMYFKPHFYEFTDVENDAIRW